MKPEKFPKKKPSVQAIDPTFSVPALTGDTAFFKKPKIASGKPRKKEIPEGLWTKCPKCSEMIFDRELDENLKVCPRCEHHFPIGARERIHALVETCSFQEMDADLVSVDVLKFSGAATYTSKLEANYRNTGLTDAVVTGIGMIGTQRVALGVMDFSFLGGSMGSVVGEKLTRLIEAGTDRRLPVVIISSSGGARMYEGMFSLMQMAKTSGALAYHAAARLPYISVLTHPTTAGVMASFASLGDLILAEPAAMIGFAGPRVIEATTQAELPPGFQTTEFLVEHGLIDAIVSRREMRERLKFYLESMMSGLAGRAA
ncbi:MAG: acetyl-CoA carboxylase carboxyltransferase subunit beta [Verrucomicrobiales bacterium]|nr:acetyl-CoA carboxylase carboxyltransferase subunit beta [Verrucomicrobiales bacterium]